MNAKVKIPDTVTITDQRCPHDHPRSDDTYKELHPASLLRQRPDGQLFCVVHGDIKV